MEQNPFSVDVKSAQTTTEVLVNTTNFYTSDSNKKGYFTQSGFIDYGTSLRPRERQDIAGLFNEMRKGTKMDFNMIISIDRAGKRYVYPKFFYPRGIKGYKVLVTDGMLRLLEDYFEGNIRVDASAEELMQYAMNEF